MTQKDIEVAQEAEQLKSDALTMYDKCSVIVISTQDDYEHVAELGKEVASRLKFVIEKKESVLKPMRDAMSALRDMFREPEEKYDALKRLLSQQLGSYLDLKEKERQDEQRRVDEQRRKESEKLEAKANAAREKGNTEKADQLLAKSTAVQQNVSVVQPTVQRAEGTKMRVTWKFRVVDPMKVPREFLMVDEKKLGAYARNMGEMAKVDGVVFEKETGVAFGGK